MKHHVILCTLHTLSLNRIVVIVQALDFSFCDFQFGVPPWVIAVVDAVQITLGALMCLLVIIRFVRESLQMYTVTRRFELSRYMNLLTRDGVFYFLGHVHVLFFDLFPLALIMNHYT